ncbi:S9 family peptidase, partial [Rubripirellula amarantea]|nr:S9 family peptidase [Rubripirellula amarantea]
MTMQPLMLRGAGLGADLFDALHQTNSYDRGETWTDPSVQESFARQRVVAGSDRLPTGAAMAPELLQAGDETTVRDFTPAWHAASQRLLGLGHTVWYRNDHVLPVRPRGIAYAVYDTLGKRWSAWDTVDLPMEPKFECAGSGSGQRVDLPGGDVLIPISMKEPTQNQYAVTVCRCRFDGRTLDYVEHGNELTIPIKRGLYEPSLTFFQGRYFLTMRNDDHGYVSVSDDGLHFAKQQRWTFDDGSDLGNYNTQQHWVTHRDGLYLVYTRRSKDNSHVFRHRAPLYIARVDPDELHVIRSTEKILVPQRGARLGNFGVTDVSPDETWVTVAEWMQPDGVEKHGSDNSVFIAKLKWNRPNDITVDSTPATTIGPYFTPPRRWQGETGPYTSPLQFADGSRVTTPDDWRRRRAEIVDQWEGLMGKWPPLIKQPEVTLLETSHRESFTQHHIQFRWTPNQTTKGYLLIPDGPGPHPGVVTVYYEPETAIGMGKADRDFALQLVRRGFVTLSIGTTQSTQARTYSIHYPDLDDVQVEPLSMLGYAAANAWYVLASRPEVDSKRIGIVGHSYGGKWAMFAACLFPNYACAAWSDAGIVFDEDQEDVNYWEPWYLGSHPRPWRKRGLITSDNPARGLYPELIAAGRDLHELHVLMAPRPFLVSGGAVDPPSRWQALNLSIEVNRVLGHRNRVAMTNRPDHAPNKDSNEVIYSFFQHFLGNE